MDQQHAKDRYRKQKIDTYVSIKDIERLQRICKRYGFESIYKILQYLVDCFLRVVDPSNDENIDVVPKQIEEMFISPKEYRRIKKLEKEAKGEKKLEIQLLIPFGEYLNKQTKRLIIKEQGAKIQTEIEEMFSDNEAWERSNHSTNSHAGMNIKQKPDQRKIKTPDDLD